MVGPDWYHRDLGPVYPLGGAFVDFLIREHGVARFLRLYNEGKPGTLPGHLRLRTRRPGGVVLGGCPAAGRGISPQATAARCGIMKRLIVFRVGKRWFAQGVEWSQSRSGSRKETRWVTIPQTETEIEEFARRDGYAIEWDPPSKPEGSPS